MNIAKRIVVVLSIFLVITVSFPIAGTHSIVQAGLVGRKSDSGVDRDFDGKFDYLIVGIEIDVAGSGYYEVYVSGLYDSNMNYIGVEGANSSYLTPGFNVLNVSLSGEYIYAIGLDPQYINYISLYGGQYSPRESYFGSLSLVPLSKIYSHTDFDPPHAILTGNILDRGVDTDDDGAFNYLEISLEVNVTKAGEYTGYVGGLQDAYGNYYYVTNSNRSYLEAGLRYLSISLSGYTIRRDRINATQVTYIALYNDYSSYAGNVSLSRKYLYTEFDIPALFTGVVLDQGLDTDADGKFNLLRVDVQINVSDPGMYYMQISGLLDSQSNFIAVYGYASASLEPGLHFVNFTLDGTMIFLSGHNPGYISSVSYSFYPQSSYYESYNDQLERVPLSRQYSYTEFDPPLVMLTGKIYDRGVDEDADGFYDFLEVGVEVNVTETGTYWVYASGLLAAGPIDGNKTYPETYYLSIYDQKTVDLSVGVHTVNLYLYGPQIYTWHQNPSNVSYINTGGYTGYSSSRSNVQLSRVYLYSEFDAPLYDAETKLIIYPDGRVVLEGSLKYTNMIPRNTGPTATGFFNLTGNNLAAQVEAGLEVTFPQELATQFPFNSTTASMRATYSNGLLNVGMNSSMVLPPGDQKYYPYYPFGQWPYNSTDGTVMLTYSGGILNVDVNGETTLPPMARSQFPFNSTDLNIVGGYAGNLLTGTITFSVLDDFTFDDVNVAFTGNKTDLVLSGAVTVMFGVPLGSFIIHNSTELEQLLDDMRSTIPGESGLVRNMTGGWLNVTQFDIVQTPLDSMSARVTFDVGVHGDFVQAIAYFASGGKNPELLYPAVNEAYSSVQGASFQIDYNYISSSATVDVTFSYDLKRFVDNALTPSEGTHSYVLGSYSMSPTLMYGDVVFVEPVANFSDIVADPTNGDIIAFYNPEYFSPQEVIIHRAVNRTVVNGTVFFQTKGDANYLPDNWWVPQDLVIGKVVGRVPLLGFLFTPTLYGYGYPNEAVPLELSVAAFSSVQEASLKLSYSSANRRFDLQFTLIDQLKGLYDELVQKLPQAWPPETPPEVKEFYEKLLNTTYASISSAAFSLTYADGIADFTATVNIDGDINKEISYVKDLYFQLYETSYGSMNMTIPWQLDFIGQTKLALDNFQVSAKLGETSFEGKIRGVTITPPREFINATDFRLRQFFNLTAPQYPWAREFPDEYQRLRITIEGGSNATNSITIYRPPSVPEPDVVGLYQKTMTWYNETFSSLKDLVFKIGPPLRGTLTIGTRPVNGKIFVNGESWGLAAQSRVVDVGPYGVSFGSVSGYRTPASQSVVVYLNQETIVTGVYVLLNGTLSITTTPVAGEVFVNGTSWGKAPQSRIVRIGTYTVSFGAKAGYTAPANQVVTVLEDTETPVSGVYQAIPGTVAAEIKESDLVSETNPFILDAAEDTGAYLVISQISAPVTVVVKSITDYEGVPPPSAWKLLGNCVEITVNDTDATVSAVIRIYYTPQQLEASGLDENTLTIHYWNTTANRWMQVESNINTNEHFVWATVNHLSMWAIMGQAPVPTIPYWLIIGGVVVAVLVISLAVFYVRRRKPETRTNTVSK